MNDVIFQWINTWAGKNPVLDFSMVFLSTSLPIIAVVLMLWLWFIPNKTMRKHRQHTAIYATCATAISLLLNIVIHTLYYHPRPFVTHHVHQLVAHTIDSSFVSDHAIVAFSIALIFVLRKEAGRWLIFIWAVLVGISRIYVGVHYPLDIIGAFGVASVVAIIVTAYFEPFAIWLVTLYTRLIKHSPFKQ
ncbi:MAG: undecaprenyl-diphosphatase [Candidatus Kurthia intestinigallinarum]